MTPSHRGRTVGLRRADATVVRVQSVRIALIALILLLWPADAQAWWNKEWRHRAKLDLVPAAAAAQIVPVRLSLANFAFENAKSDGADLRFVDADDKTPLDFHFELYNSAEQIAVAWVRLPPVTATPTPGGARTIWMYYGNRNAPPVSNPQTTYDSTYSAVFHFSEREGVPRDLTAFTSAVTSFSGLLGSSGVLDRGIRLTPTDNLSLAEGPQLEIGPARPVTVSAWIRLDNADAGLIVSRAKDDLNFQLGLTNGRLHALLNEPGRSVREESAEAIAPAKWHHFALVWSDKMTVYLNGKLVLSLAAPVPALAAPWTMGAHATLGAGFSGQMDELQFASIARSPELIAANFAAQDPLSESITVAPESASFASKYLAVAKTLANAVSLDGWVIIGLIGILAFISAEVVLAKVLLVRRIERADGSFLTRFRSLGLDPTAMLAPADESDGMAQVRDDSTLFAVYRNGVEEFRRQRDQVLSDGGAALAPANLEVIKANVDTTIVNESFRINRSMVLLTLAVSAAPFLGLLGTVVGIMWTFGAIAMAGDVNVNTIAPGVAAALATTVAGLAVAIPVMFAYNFLVTKIRQITRAMEVFANEFVGRLATQRLTN